MATYAAVDIGSNSVRMMIAGASPGAPTEILHQERQVTRLGASVFQAGRISPEAIGLLCEILAKAGSVIRKHNPVAVRAVATSAVRDAQNKAEFLERTHEALGFPVEIISGQEEARLIHRGVLARRGEVPGRALIVDVGGGSTELILSEHGSFECAFSKPLGAVRLTEVFLKNDPPSPLELHQMLEYIDEKLAEPLEHMRGLLFDRTIGTSASAAALVSAVNRIARAQRDEADGQRATLPQVLALFQQLSARKLEERRGFLGIGPRRAELIVAGAAVFLRILEAFGLSAMEYSVAGVRDGIIADLAERRLPSALGRLNPEQRRLCEAMALKYGVQLNHARKVASLAFELFQSLQKLHKLPAAYGKLLEAAGYLHDIGHFVSNTGHHKHSFYLVSNSDMPGFTEVEQHVIAGLSRYHRRAVPGNDHPFFREIKSSERRAVILLTPLLRLADGLDRSHDQRIEALRIELRNGTVAVGVESQKDTDLETWAAEKEAPLFRDTFGVELVVAAGQTVRG